MPRFAYTARDRTGAPVSDTLDAPSRKDAIRLLAARGLHVTQVAESGSAPKKTTKAVKKSAAASPEHSSFFGQHHQVKIAFTRKLRLPFLQALHDLTSSGLSAGEALRLLSLRLKDPALRTICEWLWLRVSGGLALSQAMAEFPSVFDNSTISLIQAGEATGSLQDVLGRLITHFQEQAEIRRQLITALAYPALLMCVAGLVVLFFLFFLLPRLQSLFDALGGKMPASTQLLIGTAHFLLHYGWIIAGAAVIGGGALWRWRQTPAGRAAIDALALKLPLLGAFVTARTVLSISQTLAVLLENGITTAEALRMTERQIDNVIQRAAFNEAIGRVLEGESLSLALGRTQCFPDLVLDRLSVGENTGNVVPSLKDISANYQKAITNQLNFFTRIVASVVLLSVFVFVGFIAFAIVSAVFKLSGSFKM